MTKANLVPYCNLSTDVAAVRSVGGHATYLSSVYTHKDCRIVVGEMVVMCVGRPRQPGGKDALDAIVAGVGKVVKHDILLVGG